MRENKCIYCGNKLTVKDGKADMCYKCQHKLKLVKKLCAIGEAIKRGVKK